MGFVFFAPDTDMIFGDVVGASLVRGPYCQLDIGLCEVDLFQCSAAEEGAWVGLPDLQGGTGFNLLRVQFWTSVHKKRVSTRRRMARERRGAGSSLVSVETQYYKQYIKDVL